MDIRLLINGFNDESNIANKDSNKLSCFNNMVSIVKQDGLLFWLIVMMLSNITFFAWVEDSCQTFIILLNILILIIDFLMICTKSTINKLFWISGFLTSIGLFGYYLGSLNSNVKLLMLIWQVLINQIFYQLPRFIYLYFTPRLTF